MHAGIVGRERQPHVSFIESQQVAELLGAPANVLNGVVDIRNPQGGRRIRRQLHEPDGALFRDDMGTEVRLDFNDRTEKGGIQPIAFGIKGDGPSDLLLAIPRAAIVVGFGGNRRRDDDRPCYRHRAQPA